MTWLLDGSLLDTYIALPFSSHGSFSSVSVLLRGFQKGGALDDFLQIARIVSLLYLYGSWWRSFLLLFSFVY